jgi:hypothetical protein
VAQALLGARVFCYAPHQSCHVLRAEDLILVSELPDEKAVFVANVTTAFNGILDATMHYSDVVVILDRASSGKLWAVYARQAGASWWWWTGTTTAWNARRHGVQML